MNKYSTTFVDFERANLTILSEPVKVALVAIALGCDYDSNENRPAVAELFHRYDDASVQHALNDIFRIESRQKPERHLAATPTWNPPQGFEITAQDDTQSRLAARYSEPEVAARLQELEGIAARHSEPVTIEHKVKSAIAKSDSIDAKRLELAATQAHIEKLKAQAVKDKRKRKK